MAKRDFNGRPCGHHVAPGVKCDAPSDHVKLAYDAWYDWPVCSEHASHWGQVVTTDEYATMDR